jgi:Right handed beta helix region
VNNPATSYRPQTLLLACLLFIVGCTQNAPITTQPQPITNYVDCAASSDGTGSQLSPWNTLTSASTTTFGAGDRLLFKRGTTCLGTLNTKGSGVSGKPFIIDAYGTGAKPIINGNGASDSVVIYNQQYIEIRNLEITNNATVPARRRGVHVVLENFGTGNYYRLSNLFVHDILGDDSKSSNGSAGIQLDVLGKNVPSKFNDVILDGNEISHVDRSGINMNTTFWCRSEAEPLCESTQTRNYLPWTGIIVRNNIVTDTAGDGLVLQYAQDGLAENNVVSKAAQRLDTANVGLWAWNSDHVTFQYNEVYLTKKSTHNPDGQGFDIDTGQTGTVIQYNYSHDNEGGFLVLCCAGGASQDGIVRYNISQNDGAISQRVINAAGGNSLGHAHQFYNNTIYLPNSSTAAILSEEQFGTTHIDFSNNLFYAPAGLQFTNLSSSHHNFDHNLFYGAPVGTQPTDTSKVTLDPKLLSPGIGSTGLASLDGYKLQAGSPAIKAGRIISNNGGHDFYGNAVSANCAPDIGAHQFATNDVCPPLSNLLLNSGFESDFGNWSNYWETSVNPQSVQSIDSTEPSHTGQKFLSHWGQTAYQQSSYQLVTGLTNGTYTLEAWIKTSGGQNKVALYAKNFGAGTTEAVVPSVANYTWTKYTLGNLQVSNGQIEVGIWSDAPTGTHWVGADDFWLTKN